MPINTREEYIEIGTKVIRDAAGNKILANSLKLPVPTTLSVADEFLADASRNSNATMIAQQVGRTQSAGEIGWMKLRNKKFWELNRWFRDFGYFFYLKYFSHTDGKVKIHRFYRGNMNRVKVGGEQETIDNIRVPMYYRDISYGLIDMGEDEVYVLQELAVD
jgi:hypothetical protein